MRRIIEWLGSLFGGQEKIRIVRVEGKETREARGRTRRLKEAREYKDRLSRTGNKNTNGD